MAFLYVLYISDTIAGPCLELIRRICEPASTSKPHVTVRGPVKRLDTYAKDGVIPEIEIDEPGSFFSSADEDESEMQNTVYLKCISKDLQRIYYKPDFYGSPPHITLYDGKSRSFAEKMLSVIKKLDWKFKIILPSNTNEQDAESAIREIRLKRRKHAHRKDSLYQPYLSLLFRKIYGGNLSYELLNSLSDENKIELVTKIHKHMSANLPRATGNLRLAHLMEKEAGESKSRRLYNNNYVSDIANKPLQMSLFKDVQTHTRISRPHRSRNRMGQFPTPPELAFDIVRFVKTIFPKKANIRYGDPSIGTGTFYYALQNIFPNKSICDAIGVEVDPGIASMTRYLLGNNVLNVLNEDFFNCDLGSKRNLIISNPPYIRHHFISGDLKIVLKRRIKTLLNIDVSGRAGLYLYFTLLCHNWMEQNAIAAWLLPSEFMEVDYGNALREYLTTNVSPILIHRFDPKNVQFEGVYVTSSVIVFKNIPAKNDQLVRFTFGGTLTNPLKQQFCPVSVLKKLEKWPKSFRFKPAKSKRQLLMKEIFKIQRGIATGANAYFIMERNRAEDLGIPSEFQRAILPSPRKLVSEIVESDKDGYPATQPQLSLINCLIPENVVKKKYKKLWEYFQSDEANAIRERYLISRRTPWYKQEHRNTPPFLCTYLGRVGSNGGPFRFIWNRSDALATNLYLLLYPIGKLADLINRTSDGQEQTHQLLSKINKESLQDGGRIYGGELFKIEPRELGQISAKIFENLLG